MGRVAVSLSKMNCSKWISATIPLFYSSTVLKYRNNISPLLHFLQRHGFAVWHNDFFLLYITGSGNVRHFPNLTGFRKSMCINISITVFYHCASLAEAFTPVCISVEWAVHAISSNAVATNQVIFLSVILARRAVILSCQDIPTERQQPKMWHCNTCLCNKSENILFFLETKDWRKFKETNQTKNISADNKIILQFYKNKTMVSFFWAGRLQ